MKIEIDQEKVEESMLFLRGYLDGEKDNNGNTQLAQSLEVALYTMAAFWAIYFSDGSVKISEDEDE